MYNYGLLGKQSYAFLCISEHFELIETHYFFENFREREAQNARVMGQRVIIFFLFLLFFFLHFYAFKSISNQLRHTFFLILMSAKRKTRMREASKIRGQSVKP